MGLELPPKLTQNQIFSYIVFHYVMRGLWKGKEKKYLPKSFFFSDNSCIFAPKYRNHTSAEVPV